MPLYVVSTPIGNLDDMTLRAVEALKSCDIIAAEDTRRSGMLLKHLQIKNKLTSYHDHNKKSRTPGLIRDLLEGRSVAVISDAGTPGVADPAFFLVREAVRQGVDVIPVPGASALLSALVCSGLPTDRFIFENFMPPKKGKRIKKLLSLKDETRTVVFYESPHRLLKTLEAIEECYGDIPIVVGRELTKRFETFHRGTVSVLSAHFKENGIKGEIVILFNLANALELHD